jgi:hypothetical protein
MAKQVGCVGGHKTNELEWRMKQNLLLQRIKKY